jgi:hypothetical protein
MSHRGLLKVGVARLVGTLIGVDKAFVDARKIGPADTIGDQIVQGRCEYDLRNANFCTACLRYENTELVNCPNARRGRACGRN